MRSEKNGADSSGIIDMVITMNLTFDERNFKIGRKFIRTKNEFISFPPGTYEDEDIKKTYEKQFNINVMLQITIDTTMRTNRTIHTTRNEEFIFIKVYFRTNTILLFIGRAHGELTHKSGKIRYIEGKKQKSKEN